MTFLEAVKSAYRNYFRFSGRAVRSEYWWYFLFNIAVAAVIALVEGGTSSVSGPGGVSASYNAGLFGSLWSLANLVPGLAVGVRRLHDTDRSGWWLLIAFVPLIGALLLIYWLASRGTPGGNRFGADPMGADARIFN